MVRTIFSIFSVCIAFGCFIPYGRDILRGKARPARSTRLMLTLLIILTLLQQHSIGSRLSLTLTLGEGLGSIGIFVIAMWKGIGGLGRLDLICYALLLADIIIWQLTHNSLLALHLTVLADSIAVWPTLVKTWHQPMSETPIFFIAGAIAPIFALAAEPRFSYGIALFPMYISVINILVVLLIYRRKVIPVDVILAK